MFVIILPPNPLGLNASHDDTIADKTIMVTAALPFMQEVMCAPPPRVRFIEPVGSEYDSLSACLSATF